VLVKRVDRHILGANSVRTVGRFSEYSRQPVHPSRRKPFAKPQRIQLREPSQAIHSTQLKRVYLVCARNAGNGDSGAGVTSVIHPEELPGEEFIEFPGRPLNQMEAIPWAFPIHHSMSPIRGREEDSSTRTTHSFDFREPPLEFVNMLDHLEGKDNIETVVREWDVHSVINPELDIGRCWRRSHELDCFGVNFERFVRADFISKRDRPIALAKTDLEHRHFCVNNLTNHLLGETVAGIGDGLFDAFSASADVPFSG
jgi:hypothetical protein